MDPRNYDFWVLKILPSPEPSKVNRVLFSRILSISFQQKNTNRRRISPDLYSAGRRQALISVVYQTFDFVLESQTHWILR